MRSLLSFQKIEIGFVGYSKLTIRIIIFQGALKKGLSLNIIGLINAGLLKRLPKKLIQKHARKSARFSDNQC